jgi:methionyl-tRNA formyltransferase
VEVLAGLPGLAATPQPEDGVVYAHKIDKAEARIDWALPATETDRLVRAMQPAPGAWFEGAGSRVKLIAAEPVPGTGTPGTLIGPDILATGEGALRLITVQPEGKPRMAAADWLRGRRLSTGDAV